MDVHTERLEERTLTDTPTKLRWSAIFGGTAVSLGVWVMLGAFGLAIGLSAVSPEDPDLRSVAIWLGIWSLVTPILAMFVGAFLAGRSALISRPSTGLTYGAVVWGVTTFIWVVFTVNFTGSVVGQSVTAAGRVASGLGQATAQAIGSVGGQNVGAIGNWLGIDRQDLMARANQRLEQRGQPPITAQQFQAALQDAANTAVRQGELSEDILVAAFARNTPLERQDVRAISQDILAQWEEVRGAVGEQLGQVAAATRNVALSGLDMLGKAFWWFFGSILLGLGAALAGGFLSTRRRGERETAPVVTTGRLREAPAAT